MLKRSLLLLAAGAKALALVGSLMISAPTAEADDCGFCAPPPDCYPDEPCWDEC